MAGRTIQVSHIPFIPREQLFVDFLEETIGNGRVRACRLIRNGSFNSQPEAEVSAVVETDSEESARDLHGLAKAGILIFWCATLAVQFVSPRELLEPERHPQPEPKPESKPKPKSEPKILVTSDPGVSDYESKISGSKPDEFYSKILHGANISEPKVVSKPEKLSKPKVDVPQIAYEPKDSIPAIFRSKFVHESDSEPKLSIPEIFGPKPVRGSKAESEPKLSIPEIFGPKPVHGSKAESDPKHSIPEIFGPKPVHGSKAESEPKHSIPEIFGPKPVYGSEAESESKLSIPEIFGPKIASQQNVFVPKELSKAKVFHGFKDVSKGDSSQTCLRGFDLHIGCEISENSFYVLCSFKQVIAEFEFGNRKMNLFVREGSIEYKMEVGYPDIRYIHRRPVEGSHNQLLLIRLRHAPKIYSNMCASSQCDDDGYNYKNLKNAQWVRTIDFTHCYSIGQSSSFCLELPSVAEISLIQNKFAHYKDIEEKVFLEHGRPSYSTSNLVPIINPPHGFHLPYKIIFKINSLVQHGILAWPTLCKEFFNLLRPERNSVAYTSQALKRLGNSGWNTCYRPVDWLTKELNMLNKSNRLHHSYSDDRSIENGMIEVNRVQITPSKVYFCGPEVNVSNRVTRHFSDCIENFLRVSFVDENLNTLSSRDLSQWMVHEAPQKRTKVYERVLSVLKQGIVIGDKKFEFLAFSSSQLRENSLWMFASTDTVSADGIRKWLGNFLAIKNVAKCASRMGQSFSASTKTFDLTFNEVEDIPDIKGARYIFSDGIGKISPSFAEEVSRKCGLKKTPTAFQIRYAGYKGVVAVDATSTSKLSLRPSMRKYTSDNTSLDVLNWTRYGPSFLNRQIITLLSTLGVEDHNFEKLQKQAVARLDQLVTSRDKAVDVMQSVFTGESHHVLTDMLSCGYCPSTEPYLAMMLETFRASKIQELKNKARIFVPEGRCLMGCLDETGTLNYGEVFIQISPPPGNKQFHDSGNIPTSVVKGKVIVTKNPCLHPGDIRILLAVDKPKPKLHHMVDCVVFPQQGKRPHPSECSGSDLDGDIYFISWDESLIPPQGYPPMEYDDAKPLKELDRSVTIEDIQEHFANHMINDTLGIISNSHLAFADQEPDMALSPKCLKLAQLHSIAVDFAKTGISAEIPQELHLKRYPDFMEKEDKDTYNSKRILGKLYRSVQETSQQNLSTISHFAGKAYDKDLEVMGYDRYLEEAFMYKTRYDNKLSILMDYYGIKNEAEIISGNIENLSIFMGNNKKRGNIKEAIMSAAKSLTKEAKGWFEPEDRYGDVNEDTEQTSFDKRSAKASAWYHVTYHPRYWGRSVQNDSTNSSHLISFPWVLSDILLSIKRTKQRSYGFHS